MPVRVLARPWLRMLPATASRKAVVWSGQSIVASEAWTALETLVDRHLTTLEVRGNSEDSISVSSRTDFFVTSLLMCCAARLENKQRSLFSFMTASSLSAHAEEVASIVRSSASVTGLATDSKCCTRSGQPIFGLPTASALIGRFQSRWPRECNSHMTVIVLRDGGMVCRGSKRGDVKQEGRIYLGISRSSVWRPSQRDAPAVLVKLLQVLCDVVLLSILLMLHKAQSLLEVEHLLLAQFLGLLLVLICVRESELGTLQVKDIHAVCADALVLPEYRVQTAKTLLEQCAQERHVRLGSIQLRKGPRLPSLHHHQFRFANGLHQLTERFLVVVCQDGQPGDHGLEVLEDLVFLTAELRQEVFDLVVECAAVPVARG
eukprot:scaffold90121_cov30-Tisochrysis_lutea.AAC.6